MVPQGQSTGLIPVARILATAGIGGRFAVPVCSDETQLADAPFARIATVLLGASDDDVGSLRLDTGSLFAPHGMARFAAERTPAELARLVEAVGYQAIAVGVSDLGVPRAPLVRVYRELSRRGVAVTASNLRCTGAARPLCATVHDAADPPFVVSVEGTEIAVLSFLGDGAAREIAPELAAGLEIEPLRRAIPRRVIEARTRGAELIVVVVDVGEGEEAAGRVLALARDLPEDDRPDVLLSAGTGREVLFARPGGVLPAVASPPMDGVLDVRVRRADMGEAFDVLARPVPIDELPPSVAVSAWMRAMGPRYCGTWGRALPGARLDREIDRDGLLELAAGVMRERAGAEIALINTGATDDSWEPTRERSLSASDLYVALPYDEPVVYADVDAEWLEELAERAEEAGLLTPGLTVEGEGDDATVLVAGRELEPRARYRVATIRFLANGGDGALEEGPTWRRLPGATLRGVVLDHLERTHDGDPRDDIPDPAESVAWTFDVDLDGQFSGTHISNPAEYTEAQLAREAVLTLGAVLTLSAVADSPVFSWENTATGTYNVTRTVGPDATGFVEAEDLLTLTSLLAWKGLRRDNERFYVPEPYIEGFLESEIDRPEDRDYHHLLLRATAGLRFPLLDHLDLKLSVGIEQELLDDSTELRPGAGLALELAEWRIAEQDDRSFDVEASLDYFVSAVFDRPLQSLRGRLVLAYALGDVLALTLGFDLYGRREGGQDLAVALDGTAGIRFRFLERIAGP